MFLLWETDHGKSWMQVLQLEPSPSLDAQKTMYHLQGAGEVPRNVRSTLFGFEETLHKSLLQALYHYFVLY